MTSGPRPPLSFVDLVEIPCRAVIHGMLRALRAHDRQSIFRSCCPDHRRADGDRELRGRHTHAAARAVNEHDIAGSGVGAAEQARHAVT